MTGSRDLESRLAEMIEHHVRHGVMPASDEITADRPDLAAHLAALADQYLNLTRTLDAGTGLEPAAGRPPGDEPAGPAIDGFRTLERLGVGGMGEVYKLQDLTLGRFVAAKVLRRAASPDVGASFTEFLAEAKSLALFADPRIVQIFEFRESAAPPVILMEYVDGFELGRLGPSLEVRQRARILRDVCAAIAHAHELGIQHRDLKPSNIMLDAQLSPKILDFGLSGGDPARGHFRGTPAYLAPEQLDLSQPIDGRTDVYALGVILYELLTGVVPFGSTDDALLDEIRAGQPRLPIEIDPAIPPALQAIALKGMERRAADRYQSAREMALDLDRYLAGRPPAARPTQYATTLAARARPHIEQIGDWLRLKLIYPHEAARLRAAYTALDAREDEWIVASRSLSYSQIALYLGAFVLLAGSSFYFVAHRFYGAVTGLVQPLIVLGAPFLGLNAAARWLSRRQHQAVAVAFLLAGVGLLPLFLLIWLPEAGWFVAPAGMPHQLFDPGTVSNRQLQITMGVACLWAAWLALRTRTAALSSAAALLVGLFVLAVLADQGLGDWLDAGQFDRLALHLAPLVPLYLLSGLVLDRGNRPWFSRPLYVAGGLALVAVLDLLALHGRLFEHLHLSLRPLQHAGVTDPARLDTLAALAMNGVVFYLAAAAVERAGTNAMALASRLLFTIAPFSILEPIGWLSETAEYSPRFDWLYLAAAIGIALLSHARQRRGFYYAGVVNTGVALYLIALRQQWFDRPAWAMTLVAAGLTMLVLGLTMDLRQRRRV
jgi:serine/threonine protein kinase